MKTLPDEEARLASLLRTQMPALPDDGFSRQIVTLLPGRNRSYRGLAWAVMGACAGMGFAIVKGVSWSDLAQGAPDLMMLLSTALAALADPWLLVALATTGTSLLLAYLFRRMHAG